MDDRRVVAAGVLERFELHYMFPKVFYKLVQIFTEAETSRVSFPLNSRSFSDI